MHRPYNERQSIHLEINTKNLDEIGAEMTKIVFLYEFWMESMLQRFCIQMRRSEVALYTRMRCVINAAVTCLRLFCYQLEGIHLLQCKNKPSTTFKRFDKIHNIYIH